MKRTISFLTALLTLPSLTLTASANALSENNEWLYGVYQDGTAVISSGAPAVSKYGGNVVIPSEIDGYTVVEIGWYCFTGETGLFSVEIPETVAVVGNYAFENCYGLNTVCFDSSASAGTEFIGEGAFINCYGLYQLNLPAGLRAIGDKAFSDCTALSTVNIPYGVESIGAEAFEDCTALQVINIPVTVTELGDDIFDGCTSMLTVCYEGSDSQWKEIAKDESDFEDINIIYAYSVGTDYDEPAQLPDESTESPYEEPAELPDYEPYADYNGFTYKVRTDDTVVINGYSGEETDIVIPSEIDGYPVTRIGEDSFSGREIKSLVISEGIREIGEGAFSWCNEITEVYLPKSLTGIEELAFYSCYGIENVYYSGSEADWEKTEIESGNNQLKNAHIVFNYKAGVYEKTTLLTAIILCAAAILVPIIVAIIVATRKKPVCPHCGAEREKNAKFCGACGKEL